MMKCTIEGPMKFAREDRGGGVDETIKGYS